MNWLSLLSTVAQYFPNAGALIGEVVKAFTVATTPVTGAGPSQVVKALQHLLNQYLGAGLVEDGWLGPKTDAAIQLALAKVEPYLNAVGVKLS